MDEIILYGSICVLTLFIYRILKFSKLLFIVNALIFITYVTYFLYSLFYRSQGGSAIVWWFYLLIFTWLHFVLVTIYLVRKMFFRSKNVN